MLVDKFGNTLQNKRKRKYKEPVSMSDLQTNNILDSKFQDFDKNFQTKFDESSKAITADSESKMTSIKNQVHEFYNEIENLKIQISTIGKNFSKDLMKKIKEKNISEN